MLKKYLNYLVENGVEIKNLEFFSKNGKIGVKAVDSKKFYKLKIPKKLLIPREAVEIDDNLHYFHLPFVKDEKYKDVLDEYLNVKLKNLDYDKFYSLNEEISKLSDDVKEKLSFYKLNIFFEKLEKRFFKDRYLEDELFKIGYKKYFVPLFGFFKKRFDLDVKYKIDENNLIIQGKPESDGEVYLHSIDDVFSKLVKMSDFDYINSAFSIRLWGLKYEDKELNLLRHFDDNVDYYKPKFEEDDISFLMIGYSKNSLLPYKISKELNLSREFLEEVRNVNIRNISRVLDLIYNKVEILTKAYIHQLKIISSTKICIGCENEKN